MIGLLSPTMAVPADFTILDISGTFIVVSFLMMFFVQQGKSKSLQNKTLTNWDDSDKILSLQGVGWFKRQAIRYATITLRIKHYRDDSDGGEKVEKIDIEQTLTGGIPGTTENRILDWEEREKNDDLFGYVVARSRRVKAEELSDEWLKEGWTEDTYEHGVVQAYAKSDTPRSGTSWVGDQVKFQFL